MHILIAPDAFKGSLTAAEAAEAMAAGIRSSMSDAEVTVMPLADGGEGTLDVLRSVYGGDVRHDVLYFKHGDELCALIESARLLAQFRPR